MCVCVCVCVYLCVCVYTCWSVCVCVSATSGGGRVLGLQSFLEAAEQQAVPSVLLVLAAVELPLHLEAPVHHEPRVENREAVASDVQLTGLKERTRKESERWMKAVMGGKVTTLLTTGDTPSPHPTYHESAQPPDHR